MTNLLPILAVAFAAFSVWLTLRIVNRRERWAKWTAVLVVAAAVLYVASFGPACWITSRYATTGDWISIAYAPVIWAWNNCEDPVWDWISWYAFLGASPDWVWEADEIGRFTNFVPRSYET